MLPDYLSLWNISLTTAIITGNNTGLLLGAKRLLLCTLHDTCVTHVGGGFPYPNVIVVCVPCLFALQYRVAIDTARSHFFPLHLKRTETVGQECVWKGHSGP